MPLLLTILSNGGLFLEKEFHYLLCANLVVLQECFRWYTKTSSKAISIMSKYPKPSRMELFGKELLILVSENKNISNAL